ncbi:MAG: hypothetical protein QXZ25_02770 [Candidatus Bathyarchaeia archaeon]
MVPVSANGPTELQYDDGSAESGETCAAGPQYSVKFSLPPGWTSARIVTAKYYIWLSPASFKAVIYDGDGTELKSLVVTPTTTGWFDVPIDPPVEVSGDFYIAIEWTTGYQPLLGIDSTSPDSRSYWRVSPSQAWTLVKNRDYMIRAVVEQVVAPIPEFSLTIPVATSLTAIIYLAIRKRISRRE